MQGTLGLALSGGGARGAFQVGVYERLLEHDRFAAGPMLLAGTSAGAMNTALIAAGKSAAELRAFWLALADDPPVTANVAFTRDFVRAVMRLVLHERPRDIARTGFALLRRTVALASAPASIVELMLVKRFDLAKSILDDVRGYALMETSKLRVRLVNALGGNTVTPVRGRSLAIQAVDALAGTGVRYVTRETAYTKGPSYVIVPAISVDMILASASIPLLFPPVRVGGRLIWDGGVLVNTPLAPLVDLGATEIITVLVTEQADRRASDLANLGDAVERVTDTLLENTYNVDRKLLLERNRLADNGDVRYRAVGLFEAIRPARSNVFTAGSYLDFNRTTVEAMFAAGRAAASAWLANGPRFDRLSQ